MRAATPIDLCLGALWPLRWLEGDPRDKFDPVILGSGDSVFTESANVAVNWVRANMQSLTERYGQPKVSQAGGMAQSCAWQPCTLTSSW